MTEMKVTSNLATSLMSFYKSWQPIDSSLSCSQITPRSSKSFLSSRCNQLLPQRNLIPCLGTYLHLICYLWPHQQSLPEITNEHIIVAVISYSFISLAIYTRTKGQWPAFLELQRWAKRFWPSCVNAAGKPKQKW